MLKFAICGKKKSGKNTLANLLVNTLNTKRSYKTATVGFADPLKEMLLIAFPTAKRENLYGPSELREEPIPNVFINEQPLTYRQALLDIGSNFYGRKYIKTMWDSVMESKIQQATDDIFIISDLRFKSNYDVVKKYNFFTIKIFRGESLSVHESETEQDLIPLSNFDFVIDNNFSLEHLQNNVNKLLTKYLPKDMLNI